MPATNLAHGWSSSSLRNPERYAFAPWPTGGLSMTLRPTALPAFGVFAIAARHQNFAHAAEELDLTASAVSHHVRSLEATLGVKLFQRHARGVVLTAEGRSLADAATAALSDIDAVAVGLSGKVNLSSQLRVA